uniref:Uncharacterized protein n=1 Tax=Nothobranchius furzeri TaxID=105023 RepID=A0A1A8UDB3_NOTFU
MHVHQYSGGCCRALAEGSCEVAVPAKAAPKTLKAISEYVGNTSSLRSHVSCSPPSFANNTGATACQEVTQLFHYSEKGKKIT